MKIAKIVPCYPYTSYRNRNVAMNSPGTWELWCDQIDWLISGELNSDPGVDMDLILYLRYETKHPDITIKAQDKLYSYNGLQLPRGTVIVHEMPNDTTMGFSAIAEFLKHHSEEYEYVVFQEDDIYLLDNVDGYLKEAVDLQSDIVAFGVHCIAPPNKEHITGMYAMMRVGPLKNNLTRFPYTPPQRNEVDISQWALTSMRHYNKIVNVPSLHTFKNYPKNTNLAKGYVQNYIKSKWNSAELYLYNVGRPD